MTTARAHPPNPRRDRYVAATARLLGILGVLFVVAYSVFVLWTDRPHWVSLVLNTVLLLAWAIFVVDVAVRIGLTPRGRRWHYAWHHPIEVLSAIMPVFRALRVVGLIQNLPALQRRTSTAVRAQFISLALAYATAFVFFIALATLQVERDAPGANIVTFGDAIWWAVVTIATVGYGDTYPVTSLGRLYAVMLMAGGIAIVGTASATLISYLNERVASLRHSQGDTFGAPTLVGDVDPAAAGALAPGAQDAAVRADAAGTASADAAPPSGAAAD